MAIVEDAASVLEQFVHDVANLPAEIAHLMEEMQAKEQLIQDSRNIMNHRDSNIQKFIKHNGSLLANPKEEAYSKTIFQQYDRAEVLQAEKIALAEKAAALAGGPSWLAHLDRQVRRLDLKIRDLSTDGSVPLDPNFPSLLRESSGNLVPPTSTGANTPLNPLSTSGGAPNIANAAMARMASSAASGRLSSPGMAGMQSHPLLANSLSNASALAGRQREMSVGSETKRRRLTQSIGTLPTASSGLRQSSLGPGTPKPSTPGGSRAGSVGPRPAKKSTKKVAPHQQMRKKISKGGIPKKSARRIMGHSKASPSTTGDDESVLSEGSEDENMSAQHDGAGDEDGIDVDEESDDTKYCICQRVSYGDMVACDNEWCPYQWFHWACINMTKEPAGDWLCFHCRKLPPNKIKKAT